MEASMKARQFDDAAMSVLYCMVKDLDFESLGYALLFIEDVQLLSFSWSRHFGFTPLPDLFSFEYPGTGSNYDIYLILFGVFFSMVVVAFLTGVYIGISYRSGRFRAVWPVRLLRVLSAAMSTLLLIPMVAVFVQALDCKQSSLSHEYELASFPGTACFSGRHLPVFILSFVALSAMLVYAFVMSLVYFDPDPRSKKPGSKPHGRTDTAYMAVRVLLTIVYEFAGHTHSGQSAKLALALPCLILLCYLVLVYQPFYAAHMTDIRAGIFFCATGSVVIAIGTFASNGNGVAPFAVLCVLAPVFFAAGYFASGWARRRIIMGVYSRLAVAPPIRLLSRQATAFNIRDMAGYAASGDSPELKGKWTMQGISRVAFRHNKKDPPVFVRVTDVEIASRFLRHNRDPDAIMLAHDLFAAALQQFPHSPLLRIVHARYIAGYSGQAAAAHKQLEAAMAMRPAFDVRCLLFMEWRTLEQEKNTEGLGISDSLTITSYIQFQMAQAGARTHHIEALRRLCEFWRTSARSSIVDPEILFLHLHELSVSTNKAQRHYERLITEFPKSKTNLRLYAHFLSVVCNKPEAAEEYSQAAARIEDEETRLSVARAKMMQMRRENRNRANDAQGTSHGDGNDGESDGDSDGGDDGYGGNDGDHGNEEKSQEQARNEWMQCPPLIDDRIQSIEGGISSGVGARFEAELPGLMSYEPPFSETDDVCQTSMSTKPLTSALEHHVTDAGQYVDDDSHKVSYDVSLNDVDGSVSVNVPEDTGPAPTNDPPKTKRGGGRRLSVVAFEMAEMPARKNNNNNNKRAVISSPRVNRSPDTFRKAETEALASQHGAVALEGQAQTPPFPSAEIDEPRKYSVDFPRAIREAQSEHSGGSRPLAALEPAMKTTRSTASFSSGSREQAMQRMRRQRIETRLTKPATRQRFQGTLLCVALLSILTAGYVLSIKGFDSQRARLDELKTITRPRTMIASLALSARQLVLAVDTGDASLYNATVAEMGADVNMFEDDILPKIVANSKGIPSIRMLTQVSPLKALVASTLSGADASIAAFRQARSIVATPFSIASQSNMLLRADIRYILDNGYNCALGLSKEMEEHQESYDNQSSETDSIAYALMAIFLAIDVSMALLVFWPLMREIGVRRMRVMAVFKLLPKPHVSERVAALDEELQTLITMIPEEADKLGLAGPADGTESAEALLAERTQQTMMLESGFGGGLAGHASAATAVVGTTSPVEVNDRAETGTQSTKLRLWIRFLACIVVVGAFAAGMFALTFVQTDKNSTLARLLNLSNTRRYQVEGVAGLANELAVADNTTWQGLEDLTTAVEWINTLDKTHFDCLHGTARTPSTNSISRLYSELIGEGLCHLDDRTGCEARAYNASVGLTKELVLLPLNRLIEHFMDLAISYTVEDPPFAYDDARRIVMSVIRKDIREGLDHADNIIIEEVESSIATTKIGLDVLFAMTLASLLVFFVWGVLSVTRRFEREIVQSVRLFFDVPQQVVVNVPQLRRFIESGGDLEQKP